MLEDGGACSRDRVLLPLRRQLWNVLLARYSEVPAVPTCSPKLGHLGRHTSSTDTLSAAWRYLGEVIAKVKRGFAPRPLLPLQTIGHRAPIITLGWKETGRPGRPVSGPRLVHTWRHEALGGGAPAHESRSGCVVSRDAATFVFGDLNADLDCPRTRQKEILAADLKEYGLSCVTENFVARRRQQCRGRWT